MPSIETTAHGSKGVHWTGKTVERQERETRTLSQIPHDGGLGMILLRRGSQDGVSIAEMWRGGPSTPFSHLSYSLPTPKVDNIPLHYNISLLPLCRSNIS